MAFGWNLESAYSFGRNKGSFVKEKNAAVLKEYLMHLFAQQGSGYRLRWLRSVDFTGLATLFFFLLILLRWNKFAYHEYARNER